MYSLHEGESKIKRATALFNTLIKQKRVTLIKQEKIRKIIKGGSASL